MGTLLTVIQEWYSDDDEKETLYKQMPELVLRWINEGQLRFCDKSEILQGLWEPTVSSTGVVARPTDFLREYQNRVKWTTNHSLVNMAYQDAIHLTNVSDQLYYSIFNGNFYVWAAAAGTPDIPYVKKPEVVVSTADAHKTAALEIPTEDHHTLIQYLDARFLRKKGDYKNYMALLNWFDAYANACGSKFRSRRDPPPTTISRRF
jgi:hypothetical protein